MRYRKRLIVIPCVIAALGILTAATGLSAIFAVIFDVKLFRSIHV